MRLQKLTFTLLFISMLILPFSGKGAGTSETPDFAFPGKVEKAASADLKAALKSGDGKKTVNAIIRLGLAKSAVNQDSLPSVLAEIASVTAAEKDPVTAALLNSLQATIYSQIYSADTWRYNNRETMAAPTEDYTLWSRRQFLDRVEQLCKESLRDADVLKALPITDFNGIINVKSADRIFYPTLFDFISVNAVGNLETFTRSYGGLDVLNAKLMGNPENSTLYPGETCAPLASILRVYDGLIDFHRNDPAPLALQQVNVRKFISAHLYASDFNVGFRNVESEASAPVSPFALEMKRLYASEQGNEFSGMYLTEYATACQPGKGAAEAYAMLQDFKKKYPAYFNINRIDNEINRLGLPRTKVSMPDAVAPGIPVKVDVSSVNGHTVKVDFYDITNLQGVDLSRESQNRLSLPAPMKTVSVEFPDQVPFTAAKSFEVSFPRYGVYTYRVSVDGTPQTNNYNFIRCSDITAAAVIADPSTEGWVVNASSGAPVEGVRFFFKPWSGKSGFTQLPGATGGNGSLAIDIKEYGVVSARKGDDRFTAPVTVSRYSRFMEKENLHVEFQTSLKLYRPGDEMQFSLVAFMNGPLSRRLAPERRIAVELRDANYQPVDTLTLTTDIWGRAEGSFTLPSSGLTGSFQLRAADASGKSRDFVNGATGFEVSDYKLPTFVVEKTAVNRPASVTQGASVEGTAMTYSGFPVADAKVKASLSVMSGFWWWASTSPVFFTCETATGADGRFRVDIPASAIASSPNPAGMFKCLVEVTSADGETRTMTATFNMGKPCLLSLSLPSVIDLSAPFTALVEASDMNDETVKTDVSYKISQDSTEVAAGNIPAGSFTDIIKKLAPGQYSIEFAPVDSTLAEPTAPHKFILYSPGSDICPVARPLWLPKSEVTAAADGQAEILFGSDTEGAYIRVLVSVYPGKIVERRWIRTRKGMQSVKVALPSGAGNARVSLACVKDFKEYGEDVNIVSSASKKSVKVEVVTFRDKVTPLQTEKVTLKVTPSDGASARSAVILDMSNKAIDALASNPLQLPGFYPASWYIGTNGWSFGQSMKSVSRQFRYKDSETVGTPGFELYGMAFCGYPRGLFMKNMATSIRVRGTSANLKAEDDVEEEVMAVSEMSSRQLASAGAMADSAAPTEEAAEAAAEDGGSADSPREKKQEDYRPSEIPLAFFRPMLSTAEDGTLEITYEVPDANTTWLLRALAYNKEMLTGSTSVEIVASKPVMVSQNAPRFLRTGDRALLAASVMNNTDSVKTVNVVSEVLSSSTGKTLVSTSREVTLQAKASEVATVEVAAPMGEPGLIYRVRATSGEFTDGEQSLLPVLPSEQDVVESQMFFIAPDQARFSMELPEMKGDDRAYLTFTENPSWQVVSALPGLRRNAINSSIEASAALFSACVAEGILRNNPEIARVLRKWVENPEDSALVSSLEKNQELKSMLLSSTPWVSEALSDTERMQRLALLFDRKQTRAIIESSIDLLAKTRADGGWCWTSQYPHVSQWCTEIIMEELGDLNRMGWLPSDRRLRNMIKESCDYLDREAVKEFKENPKGDYWLYVVLRDAFPEHKASTAARRVVEAQVQKCLADWKDVSVPYKAVYALILNAHGYNASARRILESMREFATVTPEKGMWWQQLDRLSSLGPWSGKIGMTSVILDAFQAVEPGCEDVDKIRQWLILNKVNNDWGDAVMTSQVITSILTSGRPLKVNTRATAVRVGDTLIEPASQEYATGTFTEQITSLLSKPAALTVDRQADYPSVGAVMTMRRLPMDEVGAVGCAEISVEKSLSVFDGAKWVTGSEFNVGDRVMVELVLKVEDDLSYLVIEDLRAAGLEPAEQLPTPIVAEGLYFYRENRDSQTNIFIDRLPRGTYRLSYELYASQAGTFASGAARAQSQYNPAVAAHSGGMILTIK